MKIIKKEFFHGIKIENYITDGNCCFIDIETTGLNRHKDNIYLVGILYFNKQAKLWTLLQFFADDNDEKEILKEIITILPEFNTLITYNGNSFDIPFINNRLKFYDIKYEISKNNSFDLYEKVKENRYYLNMENLKLKTLEKYLGINRTDIYSGKDCIGFFFEYLESKNEVVENRILQHNYDDLFYMLDTIRILDVIKDLRTISLELNGEKINLVIRNIEEKGDNLLLVGSLYGNLGIKIIYYEDNYTLKIDESNSFEISIEYRKGLIDSNKKCLFIIKEEFEFSDGIVCETDYILPNNIILLKDDKRYLLQNIKLIMSLLIKNIINKN